MTTVLKVLGQLKPLAATLSDLYTVPALKTAVSSSITICNQSGTPTSFRLSVRVAGAADTPKQYVYYDRPIGGNDTFIATVGYTLGAGDIVSVYNANATLSFNLFGQEVA